MAGSPSGAPCHRSTGGHADIRSLRFWGVDTHPVMGRLASILIQLAGIPEENIRVYESSPYCELVGSMPGVTCGLPPPFPQRPNAAGVSPKEWARQHLGLGNFRGSASLEAAEVLERLKSNPDFRKADIVLCGTVYQPDCAIFAGAGKPVMMVSTGLPFDWSAEDQSCEWTGIYMEIVGCSVDQPASVCETVSSSLAAARHGAAAGWRGAPGRNIVFTTSAFHRSYTYHVTGISLPLWAEGLPSLPWREAAERGWRQERAEVLLLPDRRKSSQPEMPERRALERLRRRLRTLAPGLRVATAREIYGDGYMPEQVLQHRAAVVMPYSDWSQTMIDWYWAGLPLFLPSERQFADIWGGRCASSGPAAPACGGGDDDWELPEDLLYAVLRRTNRVPCYAGWSPNAGRKAELDADFASTEAFVAGCESIQSANGDAPVNCFWVNEGVRAAWLKHLWFYRVPLIYHWDDPADLARKLSRWTWRDTQEHRARLSGLLNETAASARSDLVSRLEAVRQDLQKASCPEAAAAAGAGSGQPAEGPAQRGRAASGAGEAGVGVWEAEMVGRPAIGELQHDRQRGRRAESVARRREFAVVVDRSRPDEDLGLLVDASDGESLRVLEVQAGVVHEWNAAHSEQRVRPGDRILEANGARGSALGLFRALQGRRHVELLVVAA